MLPDLHLHTTASDGALSPAELLARGRRNGVRRLSITDHDTVAAYEELTEVQTCGIELVPGVELSTNWRGKNIHVLGLNIDPANTGLRHGIESQIRSRLVRAEKISRRLKHCGVPNLLDKVLCQAGNGSVGRPHFAAVLVDHGVVSSSREAFRKFLGNGKVGDIRNLWADLDAVVDWIVGSGGTAVLAHPGHYNLTNTKLHQLITTFKDAGGLGLEVCNGVQPAPSTAKLARVCIDNEMYASCGSDYHGGDEKWSQPGRFTPLPAACRPVWELWEK